VKRVLVARDVDAGDNAHVSVRVVMAAMFVVVVSCGSDGPPSGTPLVAAESPSAMVALPGGGLLYGERHSGRIWRVGEDGAIDAAPVTTVEVSSDGQRGLLGLAVSDERVFAAWTDLDERLVVAQVAPGAHRLVWEGPPTAALANGGRLAFAPEGQLVIGIGDLEEGSRADDPDAVNGKLLALDADAGPEQAPSVISSGWNNPFAFAFTPAGELWVADNAPREEAERLTRGDRDGPVTELPRTTAPSGLAAVGSRELLVCGYVSGELLRYEIVDGRAVQRAVLADDCRLGVIVLPNGRVVYATDTELLVLDG
jgi:hypothetical protein